MNLFKIFKDGISTNNPVLVQLVGLCSVLAITNTVLNSVSMGMAVIVVITASNMVVSIFRNVIPKKIRIPAFIVIIATFVTLVEMFMEAFAQPIYQSLGIFIPLIVVNCVILARAESFAYKNKVIPSIVDGLGMGIGYTVAVVILGVVREILGAGTFLSGTNFEMTVFGDSFQPIALFITPAGAFIALGIIAAIFKAYTLRKTTN